MTHTTIDDDRYLKYDATVALNQEEIGKTHKKYQEKAI